MKHKLLPHFEQLCYKAWIISQFTHMFFSTFSEWIFSLTECHSSVILRFFVSPLAIDLVPVSTSLHQEIMVHPVFTWKLLHTYAPQHWIFKSDTGDVSKIILFIYTEHKTVVFLSHNKHEIILEKIFFVSFFFLMAVHRPKPSLFAAIFFVSSWVSSFTSWFFFSCVSSPLHNPLQNNKTISKEIFLTTHAFDLDGCMDLVLERGWY